MFPRVFKNSLSSIQNPRVKQIAALREGKSRRKNSRFYIEGAREIARALSCGYHVDELFVYPPAVSAKTLSELKPVEQLLSRITMTEISEDIFRKLAMRGDHDGLIALAKIPERRAANILVKADFILIVEGVEKPGNLGAILRTADAAGLDAIVLVDSPIDAYAPNTIRSSLGAVFKVPVVHAQVDELLPVLKRKNCKVVAADPYGSRSYFDADLSFRPLAIVLGNEASGLQDVWRQNAECVRIPMAGICDSLNVSVSGAILMYEALRQRL